ncbi:MAG: hypothetical protein DHS20C18_25670 [Saprospiraceae bacterium]|nr:MAG: hypothetical protein DHS20C18_25670 [Saprospiraceae bacterium]
MNFKFLSFLAVVLFAFTSCEKSSEVMSDDALIQAIQEANKQNISATTLPAEASSLLTQDYAESYVEIASLAPELGYEVSMRRGMGTCIGERTEVYFDRNGRELRRHRDRERRRGEEGRDRHECFNLVFPVTFVMSDGAEISGTAEEIRAEIRAWYAANPDTRANPTLQFPVDLVFENGTTTTVSNNEGIRRAYASCH